jgi:hypothetical protein
MLDILKEKVHVLRDGMEHNEVKESEFWRMRMEKKKEKS